MKRIFIVGGCGFVGSGLVERLLADPAIEKVTVFDNESSGRAPLDKWWCDKRFSSFPASARDADYLRVAIRHSKPDIVFHLAANPDIAKAVTEPTIDFDQGTELTKNVLEAMRVNGVKHLIYFSGSGVYGERDGNLSEDGGPFHPISTYGASKLASEAMICAYSHMFGLRARALRFANIVGPRQTHGVGYDFLRKLAADRTRLKILGDGSQRKSYIHLDDAIAAALLVASVMNTGEACFDVFNVSTEDSLTVTAIAEMAALVFGCVPGAVQFDYTGGDRGWKGDVPKIRLACGKIRELGWRPERTSKDAMWLALLALRAEMK